MSLMTPKDPLQDVTNIKKRHIKIDTKGPDEADLQIPREHFGLVGGSLVDRYKHLMEPIKQLCDSMDIDLQHDLNEFLKDMAAAAEVRGVDAVKSFNFIAAAHVLQGATVIYGKKVDFVQQQAIDLVSDLLNKAKKANVEEHDEALDHDNFDEVDGRRRRRKRDANDPLSKVFDLEIAHNIRLLPSYFENHKLESLVNKHTNPRMPMELIPLNENEKSIIKLHGSTGESIGFKDDFCVNRCLIDAASGAMLLSADNSKYLNESATTVFTPLASDNDDQALKYVMSRIRCGDTIAMSHHKEKGRNNTTQIHLLNAENAYLHSGQTILNDPLNVTVAVAGERVFHQTQTNITEATSGLPIMEIYNQMSTDNTQMDVSNDVNHDFGFETNDDDHYDAVENQKLQISDPWNMATTLEETPCNREIRKTSVLKLYRSTQTTDRLRVKAAIASIEVGRSRFGCKKKKENITTRYIREHMWDQCYEFASDFVNREYYTYNKRLYSEAQPSAALNSKYYKHELRSILPEYDTVYHHAETRWKNLAKCINRYQKERLDRGNERISKQMTHPINNHAIDYDNGDDAFADANDSEDHVLLQPGILDNDDDLPVVDVMTPIQQYHDMTQEEETQAITNYLPANNVHMETSERMFQQCIDNNNYHMYMHELINWDELSYEQIVKLLLEYRINQAGDLGDQTALTKRVQAWSEKIEKLQAEERKLPDLLIHKLSSEIINWLKLRDAGPHQFVQLLFAKDTERNQKSIDQAKMNASQYIIGKPARWEMARYFLASLMITNTRHIDIVASSSCQHNGMLIKLLDGDKPIGSFKDMI